MKQTIEALLQIKRKMEQDLMELSGKQNAIFADIKFLEEAIECAKKGRVQYANSERVIV